MSPSGINKKCDAPSNVDHARQIFEEHGDFIHSIIRFSVRNEALSEDLFQDLFLSLISKPMPEEVQNIRGFLYRVVSDSIKDAFRRIDRYQAKINRYADRRGHIVNNRPEKSLIEVEETKKMFELIERRLPSKEACAVTLRYRNHCDIMEVAEKMGVKPRSVSRYVSVGLKKVRHVFSEKQGGNYDRF